MSLGLVSTSRLIGGAVAGAIYTSIYTNRFADVIPGVLRDRVTEAGYTGSFDALLAAAKVNTAAAYAKVADVTPEIISTSRAAVKDAYITSFRLVFLVAIAFGAIAICSALMTRSVPLENKHSRRAVVMETERAQLESKHLGDVEHKA